RRAYQPHSPKKMPRARTARNGMRWATILSALSANPMIRPLRALSLRFPTLEVLEDGFPVAALAQETLDCFAKRAVAAAARQLPLRRLANLGCRVMRRRRDPRAQHRREIRQIIAEIQGLIKLKGQLVQQPLACLELVR